MENENNKVVEISSSPAVAGKRSQSVDQKIAELSGKLAGIVNLYCANQEKGLGPIKALAEASVQSTWNLSTISAMADILFEKLGITSEEIVRRTMNSVEQKILEAEAQFGVKFFINGSYEILDKEEETHGQGTSEKSDH